MSGIVFINYRRRDAEHVAGRLFDRLEQDFSEDQLFFDVDNIPPGEDFVAYLHDQVEACDVLLALVGPNWRNELDAQDHRGEEQTRDFVRIEIEAALQKGKKVIPVLVSGAEMPREDELPPSLRPFSRRNAVRLTHERFKADAAGIANALKAALADAEEARAAAEAEAARHRAEEERKAKAARDAEAQAKKDETRREAVAGLSPEQVAKAEELANWDFIKDRDDPQEFRDHLARFPDGVSARMASEKLEALLWRDLGEDEAALNAFIDEFPDGMHAGEARARIDTLRTAQEEARAAKEREAKELAAWNAVRDTADADTLDAFLADWPNGAHAAEARRLKRALHGGLFTKRKVMIGGAAVAVAAALVTAVAMFGLDRVITYAQDSSLRTFKGSYESVFDATFSPDGKTIVSTGSDPSIEIVSDVSRPQQERANGTSVKLWDVATGEVTRSLDNHWDAIDSVAFSPDGGTFLAAGISTLRLWDAATGEELHKFEGGRKPAAFSPDGRTLASGGPDDGDYALRLWDVETGEGVRRFDFSGQGRSLAFAPDGRTIVEGFRDIALGDVATGALIGELEGHEGQVDSVAFTPDGGKLLSGSWDGTAKLWNIATGEVVRTFGGHTDAVRAVALSPDGRTALSASDDKTLKMWDVKTGDELRTFKGHQDQVWSVVFAPDGRTALSASRDGTMKLWDVTR